MSTGRRPVSHRPDFGYASRRLAPTVEVVESRLMLATGLGVIAGTAFVDGNNNQALDVSEAYLAGAKVQLFQAGGLIPIASQTTGADGGYSFTGLVPGDYVVSETPPTGARVSGTQVQSQVEPAAAIAGNMIRVTVPARSFYLNYNGVLPGGFQVSQELVNGTPETDSIGPFRVSLGTAPGGTDLNAGFLSYCLDDIHRLSFGGGEKFAVRALPITTANNGITEIPADRAGRIAFLYNHFGNASLSNIQGPALQLAIWELLYDTGATHDFSNGNFQIVGPDAPFTDQATLDQVLAQASTYFLASAGKSEAALLLDASPSQTVGQLDGSQSMIAEGSFNFANQPVALSATSSLRGLVYCDANHDGRYDTGDMPVAGALMALTGNDGAGNPVKHSTRSDVNGRYGFVCLDAGTYTITLLTAPAGLVPGRDTQGIPGNGSVQVNRIADVALPGGLDGKDNNFGLVGQTVSATRLELLGIHQQPSRIVLHFNGPLNAMRAQDPSSYSLIGLGLDETFGTADDVHYRLSATYNPAQATVTLQPDQHLNIHRHYVLRLNLPGVNACAPPVASTSVFGRSAVPYFDVHGRIVPNPPLTPSEIRHDALVVARTMSRLGETGASSSLEMAGERAAVSHPSIQGKTAKRA
jgi:hypothetical protein